MVVCVMRKRFKLSLVSLAIFSATLGLSGCSQDINRTSGDSQSTILLRLSQGTREVNVFEDPTFSVLLETQRLIDSPVLNHFAFSGICISDDRLDGASLYDANPVKL